MKCLNTLIIRGLVWALGGVFVLCAACLFRTGAIPQELLGLVSVIVAGLLAALNRSNQPAPSPPKDGPDEP